MLIFVYFIITLSVLLIFIGFITYIYWNFKKRYTKERFAFVITAQSTAIVFLITPIILGSNSFINTGVEIINQLLSINIKPIENLQFSARVLGLTIVSIY